LEEYRGEIMVELKIKEIKTLNYDRPAVQQGYSNQTLCVNLSDSDISIKQVTEKMKEVFAKVPDAFNPDASQGLNAVFQYDITGDDGGTWNVTIEDGTCQVQEGSHDAPTVTMTMSSETWLALVNNELNGIQAFMSGKLKVNGDIMLAQRIPDLFSF
jgi:putative sterol carrier protein